MESDKEPNTVLIVAGLIAGVCLLFLLCRPVDPNTELARTAREAVQLARDAGSSAESAVLWAGRFRLLAVTAGVSIPLVVVYLIWRWSARSDLDLAEVTEVVERYQLPKQSSPALKELQARPTEGLPSENTDHPAA